MFLSIRNYSDIRKSIRLLVTTYPVIIIPLIIPIAIPLLSLIYVNTLHISNDIIMYIIIPISISTLSSSISYLLILSFAYQIEHGRNIKFIKSVVAVIFNYIPKSLLIILLWGISWIFIECVNLFCRKSSIGIAASRSSTSLFRQGILLSFPIIVYDNANPFTAFQKASYVSALHAEEFSTCYSFSSLYYIATFPIVLFYLIEYFTKLDLVISSQFVLSYSMVALSLTFVLEEIFNLELYLWHRLYERKHQKLMKKKKYQKSFTIRNVRKPDLLDSINEFDFQ